MSKKLEQGSRDTPAQSQWSTWGTWSARVEFRTSRKPTTKEKLASQKRDLAVNPHLIQLTMSMGKNSRKASIMRKRNSCSRQKLLVDKWKLNLKLKRLTTNANYRRMLTKQSELRGSYTGLLTHCTNI